MKHITERSLIETIVRRWDQHYSPGRLGPDEIREQLASLNLAIATVAEINEIIGNDSWTSLSCNECGKRCTELMQLGTEEDYFHEGRIIVCCKDCLIKAYQLITEAINDIPNESIRS